MTNDFILICSFPQFIRRGSKRRKLTDRPEWTMPERKKVQEGVLTFGRPCWKELKVRRNLDRRSLAEIR